MKLHKVLGILTMTAITVLSCSSCHIYDQSVDIPKKARVVHEVGFAPRKILARVTFYSPDPKYGSRVADSRIKKAIRGVTVAAHPDFKFGSHISIPALKNKFGDDKFIVQDRGTAVTRKTASGGKGYVFDIFVNTSSEVKTLAKSTPAWTYVYVMSNSK